MGADSAAATILARGDTLAGYRVLDVIGMGGMAIVYSAEQLSLGRRVALKVLAPQLAGDPDFRERFRREGKHAAALDHPNVVTIYDSGECDGRLYMAMRLVEGTTLADRLTTGRIAADQVIALLAPIADALDDAHRLGLVHRDVKPQNILIGANGHPFLADFGIARVTTTTAGLTAVGEFVGSVNYAAPEQIDGRPVAAAGDIYALAAVLYQSLTGEVPYPRDTDAAVMHAHLHAEPPTMQLEGAHASDLARVIARGLEKDPERRYQRAGELMSDAAAAIAALPPAGRALPLGDRSPGEDRSGAQVAGADQRAGDAGASNRDRTKIRGVDDRTLPGAGRHAPPRDQRPAPEAQTPAPAAEAQTPAPAPQTPAPAPLRRRRWLRVAAPAGVALTGALAAIALLGGGDEAPATRVAASQEMRVTYRAPWRVTSSRSEATQALTAPVVLTNGQTTFAAGRVARSARVPAAAPPQLVALYGKPAGSVSVTVGTYPARRHVWSIRQGSLVSVSLARPTTDLAIICESAQPAAALRSCVALASRVKVSGERVVAPGADPKAADELADALAPISAARTMLRALKADSLWARAARARALAELEAGQLDALKALVPYERNRAALRRMTNALGVEAKRLRDLGTAARANKRADYASARRRLISAGRATATAAIALRRDGFAIPTLRPLHIPRAPSAPAMKASSTGSDAPSTTPPAAAAPPPSRPRPAATPKKPPSQFGPTEKQDL